MLVKSLLVPDQHVNLARRSRAASQGRIVFDMDIARFVKLSD